VGDLLYFVSDRGVASCVDARSGDVIWTERLPGAHSASPVYAGGHIYFCAENGSVTVLRPGDAFRKVAENHVDGRIMASPAFVEPSIFLRTDTHLYRIQRQTAEEPPMDTKEHK
jgi:outer membrane protein assembly factor BamB